MGLFEISSILIALAALFGYLNRRYVRLPNTIGIMLLSLACSLAIIALGETAHHFRQRALELVSSIDFNRTLFHGMLAFLLFAGSLTLNLEDLRPQFDAIALLSVVGTAASTALIGIVAWTICGMLALDVPLPWCFLLGALISPTDPIAVLGIMRNIGAPKPLETLMAGESLFNDGVAVAIFLSLLAVIGSGAEFSWGRVLLLLLRQSAGGVVVGMAAGMLVYRLMSRVDNYQVEILLTLALAMGGYTLAEALDVSAPIAVVTAGLFIGNRGRTFAMPPATLQHLDMFWELIDEVLNALLFLLIGLEVLIVPFARRFIWAGLAAVALVLLARWITVGVSLTIMRSWRRFSRGAVTVLTWGGLRGGLSVAMALALPPGRHRDLILVVTYCVVVFSVFGQGLSASAVFRRATATRAIPPR